MLLISPLRRQKQVDLEFEDTLSSVEGFEKSGDGRMKLFMD